MVQTRTLRAWWSQYRCLPGSGLETEISLFGRNAGTCATPAYFGFVALERALGAAGYSNVRSVWIPRACPTGIAGKTCRADGTNCSLHNYGIAVDVDPFGYGNPHFQKPYGNGWNFEDCKLTGAQVDAAEAIRNTSGEQYFRWLGWAIGDTMHFELQVPPSRTAVDWNTVPGGMESIMLYGYDIGKMGEPSAPEDPRAGVLQAFLVRQGFDLGTWGPNGDGVDSTPGDDTRRALNQWKLSVGITPTTSAGEGKIGTYEQAAIYAAGGNSSHNHDDRYPPKTHSHTGKVTVQ